MISFIRFYLSFENALCKDYVTEKTFNALRLNTVRSFASLCHCSFFESFYKEEALKCKMFQVPIVFGGADYRELLPPGSFINALDFPSPKGDYKF